MRINCSLQLILLQMVNFCLSNGRSPPNPFSRGDLSGRLLGSEEARPREFPYQLLLQLGSGKRFCGASLVELHGVQFAVTAAHCTESKMGKPGMTEVPSTDQVNVIAGLHFREDPDPEKEIRRAVRIKMHPQFKKPMGNDIALVFFEPPFPNSSSKIRPIDLPENGWNPPPYVTISGWGIADAEPEKKASNTLRKLTMETISNEDCEAYSQRTISESLFCVLGDENDPRGTCSGDSGGPAAGADPSTNKVYLFGIVSFHGGNCGEQVSAFTSVSSYTKWINNTVTEYKRSRGEHQYEINEFPP